MSLSKISVLATSLALGLSIVGAPTASVAQAVQDLQLFELHDNQAFMVSSETGKVHKAKIAMTEAHHTKAMAMGGRELSKGAMIYKHDGRIYIVEDKAGGKTSVVQETFVDMFPAN